MAPPKFAGLSGQPLANAVSAIATTGFLLFGYDQGVMSGIITAPAFNNEFPATKDNSTIQGTVTSIYEIGCLMGALTILWFGDLLGRRKAIITGGIIMILGVIIQVTAQSNNANALAQFIVGRIIMGIGNGVNTSSIPTWQADTSIPKNRGLQICISGGTIAFGSLLAYWIDYGASYGNPDLVWRFPIAFQIIFALILSIGTVFLPESPRWLLIHERTEEATNVIAALRGWEVDSIETQDEVRAIQDSIRASGFSGKKSTPFSALTTSGRTQHLRRMLLGAGSQLMQQFGGCNAVIYYFPILFQTSLGSDHNFATLMGGINMIVYAASATVSWFFVERLGRRQLILLGTIGQALAMLITFACLIPDGGRGPSAKGSAVGLFLFIAAFGATWLPLPWLLPAELNPVKTRAKANAVSTCTNWLSNFVIVMITPIMITNIGFGTYIFFFAMNVIFLPVLYLYYPETKGRSLEEIDIIFAKGYSEQISYVKAAKELPALSPQEVEREAIRYGLIESSERAGSKAIPINRMESDGGDSSSSDRPRRISDPEKM